MKVLYALMLLAFLALSGCAPVTSQDWRERRDLEYPPGGDDLYYTRQVLGSLEQQPKSQPNMRQ